MTSGTATHRNKAHHREAAAAQARRTRRTRRRLTITAAVLALLAGTITAMMLTSRPTSSTATRPAPDFTLTDTAGHQVRLADHRGHTVVLYFSEGAGCGSCLQQMAAIEKNTTFANDGITVLPIVMNTREQITTDMNTYGVKTPFLLDDGTVSRAYGTLGHGMHAGLPGHSFVLIDPTGRQRWYGEYPSMWLAPTDLLTQIHQRLA
jgi:peroxiredoxin